MSSITNITVQEHPKLILLLGSGLIGSAIERELASHFSPQQYSVSINWLLGTSKTLRKAYQELGRVTAKVFDDTKLVPSIHIIWAAGTAGFSSSKDKTNEELEYFIECLATTSDLAKTMLCGPINFHLVSSAGGIFEGQRFINEDSLPSPRRPYGHLKYTEEQQLLCYQETINSYIYRLSSVYGLIQPRQRRGLISTLVENSLTGRSTFISGSMNTLRDFVWLPDVARFIVKQVEIEIPPSGPFFLGSGKSATIESIKRRVEFYLRRRIYCQYQLPATNSADISISSRVLPSDWAPTHIETNIFRVLSDYRLFHGRRLLHESI